MINQKNIEIKTITLDISKIIKEHRLSQVLEIFKNKKWYLNDKLVLSKNSHDNLADFFIRHRKSYKISKIFTHCVFSSIESTFSVLDRYIRTKQYAKFYEVFRRFDLSSSDYLEYLLRLDLDILIDIDSKFNILNANILYRTSCMLFEGYSISDNYGFFNYLRESKKLYLLSPRQAYNFIDKNLYIKDSFYSMKYIENVDLYKDLYLKSRDVINFNTLFKKDINDIAMYNYLLKDICFYKDTKFVYKNSDTNLLEKIYFILMKSLNIKDIEQFIKNLYLVVLVPIEFIIGLIEKSILGSNIHIFKTIILVSSNLSINIFEIFEKSLNNIIQQKDSTKTFYIEDLIKIIETLNININNKRLYDYILDSMEKSKLLAYDYLPIILKYSSKKEKYLEVIKKNLLKMKNETPGIYRFKYEYQYKKAIKSDLFYRKIRINRKYDNINYLEFLIKYLEKNQKSKGL